MKKYLSILLVEDDEIERMKFKKVCRETSFSNVIMEANNGENALKLLEDEKYSFDLIISDINMPRMDGIEFLVELKKTEKYKNTPVVIISTSNNNKDLKKCYELGVSGYFTKPIKYADYKQKVLLLLDYWKKSELV